MPLSAQLPEPEPLNMTPMIDVAFNLLIFFMLTTAFYNQEQSLELSVPKIASVNPAVAPPANMVINVQADGRIKVADKFYSTTELESMLRATIANFPGQGVAIRGDEEARYQAVASVLGVCKAVGIRKMDVMVQPSK